MTEEKQKKSPLERAREQLTEARRTFDLLTTERGRYSDTWFDVISEGFLDRIKKFEEEVERLNGQAILRGIGCVAETDEITSPNSGNRWLRLRTKFQRHNGESLDLFLALDHEGKLVYPCRLTDLGETQAYALDLARTNYTRACGVHETMTEYVEAQVVRKLDEIVCEYVVRCRHYRNSSEYATEVLYDCALEDAIIALAQACIRATDYGLWYNPDPQYDTGDLLTR